MSETFNPSALGENTTLSNGNLTVAQASYKSYAKSISTKASGKWYLEFSASAASVSPPRYMIGVIDAVVTPDAACAWNTAKSISAYVCQGASYPGSAAWGQTLSSLTDKVCIAVDCDNKTIKYRVNNGTWSATKSWASAGWSVSGINVFITDGDGTFTGTINFGGSSFSCPIPDGYSAWDSVAITDDQSII